jgi:hypothetical protein
MAAAVVVELKAVVVVLTLSGPNVTSGLNAENSGRLGGESDKFTGEDNEISMTGGPTTDAELGGIELLVGFAKIVELVETPIYTEGSTGGGPATDPGFGATEAFDASGELVVSAGDDSRFSPESGTMDACNEIPERVGEALRFVVELSEWGCLGGFELGQMELNDGVSERRGA